MLYNYNKPPSNDAPLGGFAGKPALPNVINPEFDDMETLLDAQDDPVAVNVYTLEPIPVEDYDATGDPLPVAIEKLISPYKRAFYFQLGQDNLGRPTTTFVFYRLDDTDDQTKDVYLAPAGGLYDPSTSNVAAVSIHRQADAIVNNVILDTELVRYEACFTLAPGFTPSTNDVNNRDKFTEGDPNFTGTNVNAYRLFLFDEDGEGHWKYGDGGNGGAMVTTIAKLDDVLGAPTPGIGFGAPPIPVYANHRRPGLSPLFSRDELGEPIAAQLWISANYAGPVPGVYNDTGDWQQVSSGGWELLKDRLGIRITCPKVYDWNIGKAVGWAGAGQPPSVGGNLDLIKIFGSDVPSGGTRYTFRLTVVIESDQDLGVKSDWSIGSTTFRDLTRRIDCRDRFKKHIIMPQSNLSPSDVDVADRDDTVKAQDYADAISHAHACAPLSGTITIPRLSLAYDIGDAIASIDGREVSLRVNQGSGQNVAAEYPFIESIDFDFDNRETTTLHIHSDHTEVPRRRRR